MDWCVLGMYEYVRAQTICFSELVRAGVSDVATGPIAAALYAVHEMCAVCDACKKATLDSPQP